MDSTPLLSVPFRKPARGRIRECLPTQVLAAPPWKPYPGRSVDPVDNRSEVREFLLSRRARITPEQAGLPAYGGNRRVPGLRREEVAMLAGRQRRLLRAARTRQASPVSPTACSNAVADALQLDEAERTHLFDLARTANATASADPAPAVAGRRSGPACSGSSTRSPTRRPGFRNGRLDVLAANQLGARPVRASSRRPGPARQHRPVHVPQPPRPGVLRDWDTIAKDMVAVLRAEAGRNPYDKASDRPRRRAVHPQREFRILWAATTCFSTAPAASGCTTRSSATSTSPTRRSTCPPTPASDPRLHRRARPPPQDALRLARQLGRHDPGPDDETRPARTTAERKQ